MTTELVLLLAIFAFIVGGLFFGEKGPIKVFERSGPRLAARIERQITIGRDFKVQGNSYQLWQKPPGNPPDGHL
jgi:hypothetical protein